MTQATFLIRENARQNLERGRASNMPLFVPRSQIYYWSATWQDGERDALGDLGAGRYRIFQSGADAADWLLSDDD
jgi:hypothetical protein